MENRKEKDIFKRTAKISLVVYFPIIALVFIACLVLGLVKKDWTFTYAWLVCLGPCTLFVLISSFLPIERLIELKKKQLIFGWTVLYILKYLILFIVPILCTIYASQYFNKWIMLALTLVTPIIVFIMKMIVVNDKKNKAKEQAPSTNTIKF